MTKDSFSRDQIILGIAVPSFLAGMMYMGDDNGWLRAIIGAVCFLVAFGFASVASARIK